MARKIVWTLAAACLTACAWFGDGASAPDPVEENKGGATEKRAVYTPIEFDLDNPRDFPSLEEQKRCTDAGGVVQQAGLIGAYRCTQDLPDAGKVCSDGSDCIGQCIGDGDESVGRPGTGTCQATDNPFGCYAVVEDGFVMGMLCVD